MEEMWGACFAGSSPPFLGREGGKGGSGVCILNGKVMMMMMMFILYLLETKVGVGRSSERRFSGH